MLLLGVLVWGVLIVKNHLEFQNEMVRIVHRQEVKKLIVEDLKQEDPYAFIENGKIQSYEIDDKTIEHNPMGGIMFRIIINGDKEITENFGLRKYSEDGPIEQVGVSRSVELRKLLEE